MNVASLLILLFLAVTFIQSGYDKVTDWRTNVDWLKGHFANTVLRNSVSQSLVIILILELLAGIFCVVGSIEIVVNGGRTFGFYGAIFACITLIILLFGQRIAKDYDGARTIAIYFIPAVMAVYWLG